jgi:hypothetical protein
MQILNPFGTGKIVMFQVRYDKEYHLFELTGFMLCGLFGVSCSPKLPNCYTAKLKV